MKSCKHYVGTFLSKADEKNHTKMQCSGKNKGLPTQELVNSIDLSENNTYSNLSLPFTIYPEQYKNISSESIIVKNGSRTARYDKLKDKNRWEKCRVKDTKVFVLWL